MIDCCCAPLLGHENDDKRCMSRTALGKTADVPQSQCQLPTVCLLVCVCVRLLLVRVVFSAPEILCRQGVDEKVDMWALGVVMWVLLTGRHPFEANGEISEEELARRIAEEEPDLRVRSTVIEGSGIPQPCRRALFTWELCVEGRVKYNGNILFWFMKSALIIHPQGYNKRLLSCTNDTITI